MSTARHPSHLTRAANAVRGALAATTAAIAVFALSCTDSVVQAPGTPQPEVATASVPDTPPEHWRVELDRVLTESGMAGAISADRLESVVREAVDCGAVELSAVVEVGPTFIVHMQRTQGVWRLRRASCDPRTGDVRAERSAVAPALVESAAECVVALAAAASQPAAWRQVERRFRGLGPRGTLMVHPMGSTWTSMKGAPGVPDWRMNPKGLRLSASRRPILVDLAAQSIHDEVLRLWEGATWTLDDDIEWWRTLSLSELDAWVRTTPSSAGVGHTEFNVWAGVAARLAVGAEDERRIVAAHDWIRSDLRRDLDPHLEQAVARARRRLETGAEAEQR